MSSRRCNFQKKISLRRLISTDLETELFPSVKIADGNNSVGNAVGVIRFSGSVKIVVDYDFSPL
jgi:hypothetical protein